MAAYSHGLYISKILTASYTASRFS